MTATLITGGAGFIGANFVRHMCRSAAGGPIVVLDKLTYAGNRANLDGLDEILFVEGDIGDARLISRLLDEHAIDRIVHFAAESHVDRSIAGPALFFETNLLGTVALLDAAKAAWLDAGSGRPHRFHHISTDEVYGTLGLADPAFTETTRYAPNSPYAASKAAADHAVRAYRETYGLETTITNCSNNYGPYQYPEKLIPLFLTNALEGQALPIYGDGMQRRDWLHVADHCAAIEAVLERGEPGEVYNVGGGAELPNLELIDRICAAVDRAFAEDETLAERFPDAPAATGAPTAMLKSHVEDRPGHDRRYAIDASKLARDLDVRPEHDIETGLAETVRWYLDNEPWWRAIMARSVR